MDASRRLRLLQSHPGNNICLHCSHKNPQCPSVSYGVFIPWPWRPHFLCPLRYHGFLVPYPFDKNGAPSFPNKVSPSTPIFSPNTTLMLKKAANQMRPDGIPPSQGAKYVGFGSRNASQGDVLSAVTQAIDEYKVNEAVGVVSAKTTEIGQKTWGIMKGVMALASQKVEEFTKEGSGSGSGWQVNQVSSGSWDDWGEDQDSKDTSNKSKKEESYEHDSWAGWDDKDDDDDGFEKSYQKASNKNKVGCGYGEK